MANKAQENAKINKESANEINENEMQIQLLKEQNEHLLYTMIFTGQ